MVDYLHLYAVNHSKARPSKHLVKMEGKSLSLLFPVCVRGGVEAEDINDCCIKRVVQLLGHVW